MQDWSLLLITPLVERKPVRRNLIIVWMRHPKWVGGAIYDILAVISLHTIYSHALSPEAADVRDAAGL